MVKTYGLSSYVCRDCSRRIKRLEEALNDLKPWLELPWLSLAAKVPQKDQRNQVVTLECHRILRGVGPSPNKPGSDFVSPVSFCSAKYKGRFLLLI